MTLADLAAPVRAELVQRHQAREAAFAASRDVIRAAANAIRAVHRGEFDLADELLAESRRRLTDGYDAADGHPEVRYAGFLADAEKEVAEAALTRSAVAGSELPGPTTLGVEPTAWLHGLSETIGELRRAALDAVRSDDIATAESRLSTMQEILEVLVTIDVPDAISRGLRRSTDGGRAITERTRGDLTAAIGQQRLREALDAHRVALEATAD